MKTWLLALCSLSLIATSNISAELSKKLKDKKEQEGPRGPVPGTPPKKVAHDGPIGHPADPNGPQPEELELDQSRSAADRQRDQDALLALAKTIKDLGVVAVVGKGKRYFTLNRVTFCDAGFYVVSIGDDQSPDIRVTASNPKLRIQERARRLLQRAYHFIQKGQTAEAKGELEALAKLCNGAVKLTPEEQAASKAQAFRMMSLSTNVNVQVPAPGTKAIIGTARNKKIASFEIDFVTETVTQASGDAIEGAIPAFEAAMSKFLKGEKDAAESLARAVQLAEGR